MNRTIKQRLKDSIVGDVVRSWRARKARRDWIAAGKPVPPPHSVKVATVREYRRRFGVRTLIETGTFRGDMLSAVRRDFDRLVSIELDETLARKASERFARLRRIQILQGDSGERISDVLRTLREPALFWLDGHWVPKSGEITARGAKETPIEAELDAVLAHPVRGHVLLVDDARTFNGVGDYPTVEQLRAFVRARCADCVFEVADDIIRIHRPAGPDARA